ncbi:MAG: Holliday junction resolvase RuvX [Simkania sp.]|nr:Holliday junction resolvase RuvX [Simkania sp.]
MSRIAAIDYGKARIGLAVSDERAIIAQPMPFLKAGKTLEETAALIAAALGKYSPLGTIVIGLPLHMSGHESPMSAEVRKLGELLETLCNIPVALWDERLTTSQVEKTLKGAGMRRKERTQIVDSLSATLLLQNFLDFQ